jgi:dephospho-CoA kinase
MKVVVGLSGRIGAGKGTVSSYLRERLGAGEHRFSDILVDVLGRLHVPPEREALQRLGASLRAELGADVLINAFERKLMQDPAEVVSVDGIRYPNEVEMLRKFKKSLLIFVAAPAEMRFERIRLRGEKGEDKISYNEFLEAEDRETERHLDLISGMADLTIDNSGTVEELYQKLDSALKEHGLRP